MQGGEIGTLRTEKMVANTGAMALQAGLEMGISYEPGFMELQNY